MFVSKIMPLKRVLQLISLFILAVIFYACAKTGTIYGGPKDEEPPKVVKARPPENTVNFVPQKRILLVFDEYIQLKNIIQELVISPPIEGRLNTQIKGKSLVVEFPDEAVFDSTTYTINFGNAIADNNEGNILENFKYVFSLKDYIDTLNVDGRIVDAFNLQPDEEGLLVMLYKNLNDSAPLTELPSYITRSDAEGDFTINHIEPGIYRIFALKDANLNMLYDLPNERVAFADSVIEITAEKFIENERIADSLRNDSLLAGGDSLLADSLLEVQLMTEGSLDDIVVSDTLIPDTVAGDSIVFEKYYTFHTELFFFEKKVYTQYMTNYLRPRRELLSFTFNEEMADTFEIYPLNYIPDHPDWFLLEASEGNDTLNFWLTDTTMLGMDSLTMEFCYPLYDSSGFLYHHPDTLLMRYFDDEKDSKRSKSKDMDETGVEKAPVLELGNNIVRANAFDLNRNLVIKSTTPLSDFIRDSIHLFRIQDTLEFPVQNKAYLDTNSFYRLVVAFKPEEQTPYRLFVSDSVIRDIYGITNDTIEYKFKTQSLGAYATLNLNVSNVQDNLILQLLTEKEEIVKERYLIGDSHQRFEYLNPGKYILKIVVDRNNNHKWDTGDYFEKLQPEKVIYFDQPVELRANWEMEFNWVVP